MKFSYVVVTTNDNQQTEVRIDNVIVHYLNAIAMVVPEVGPAFILKNAQVVAINFDRGMSITGWNEVTPGNYNKITLACVE